MHLSRIWIHPLKSGAALPREEARLEARGLAGDRRWLVVDAEDAAITQREVHALALLRAVPDGEGLRVSAPVDSGAPGLRVPPPTGARRRVVRVWGQAVDAADAGEDAAAWFSAALDRRARLVRMDERSERRVVVGDQGPGWSVSFADALPLLVVTSASLAELERRLVERGVPLVPLAMERFRPNLVVEGAEPFAEDRWARIAVGEVEIELVKPCARCVMTTLDPSTAQVAPSGEPLRTLAGFRRVTDGDYPHEDGQVYFGWSSAGRGPIAPNDERVVRVGDEVRVLERRAPRRGSTGGAQA